MSDLKFPPRINQIFYGEADLINVSHGESVEYISIYEHEYLLEKAVKDAEDNVYMSISLMDEE